MRFPLLLASLLSCPLLLAQPASSPARTDAAAAVLAFSPSQRAGVSDEHFAKGRMVLRETAKASGGEASGFDMADFFNAFIAFGYLQEEERAREAYAQFRAWPGSCEYVTEILASRVGDGRYGALRPDIERDVETCAAGGSLLGQTLEPETVDLGSDPTLHLLLAKIEEADQRHRSAPLAPDWAERQRPLDEQNLRLIDSLYAARGTYIGRTLVGDQAATMWAVIQHSNPEAMQRYAPVIREAVAAGELDAAPYRMLVDRIYALTEGYQIFGSQGEVPLGTEAQQRAAKRRYGLE
jgi:hypothetical protein